MNNKDLTITISTIAALLAVAVLIMYNENKKLRKEKKIDNKKIDELKVEKYILLNNLLQNAILTDDMRKILKTISIDLAEKKPKYSIEIKEILSLASTNHDKEAIFKLIVIIENLLKEQLQNNEEFKKKENATFEFCTHLAFKEKILNEKERMAILHLKEIRNNLAHNVGVTMLKEEIQAAFLLGIVSVRKLSRKIIKDN